MMRICLNMIVKNEAARIERCLKSVAPYISCYAITDTGSTDGTEDLIWSFFRSRDIVGKIDHAPFVNFEQARNVALDNARNSTSCDYLLLVDADMELVVDDPGVFMDLSAPAYSMVQRSDTLSYWNTRLLRRDVDARYVGVTHEYLSVPGPAPEKLYGAWFRDHQDGANRPGKLERDAAMLEEDIRPKARSFYYLGQSLKDAGKPTEAALSYKVRASLGGWQEEAWSALLNAARCEALPSDRVIGLIDAFNARPSRAEPLLDLARHYRERGMNDAAMIFAEAGLKIPKPDDVLFVEDYPYDWGFREEISICGFYTADRARAHDLCEELTLSRAAPQATREQAWRNLFSYTRPLAEQAPSLHAQRIDFTPPDGYQACNPSVCRVGDRIYLNVRAVNYLIGQDGRYVMPDDGVIRTRNFLFELQPMHGHDDFLSDRPVELRLPASVPQAFGACLGFEDLRLFADVPYLFASATSRQHNPEGWCEIVVTEINPQDGSMGPWHPVRPEGPQRQEKNWMPIIGDGGFIYSCDPVRILDLHGKAVSNRVPPIAADQWSGSSQAIPFEVPLHPMDLWSTQAGHLALIHERQAYPDPMRGQRNYQRRFVWFDADLNIRRISRRFFFGDGEGEFVCGMCWHPDGKRLVISYGVLDREAWLATVDADEVRAMLREVGDGDGDRARMGVRDAAAAGDRHRELGLEATPAGQFVLLPLKNEAFPTDPWLDRNTNALLRTEVDLDYAIDAVKANGWSVHPDRTKNWDCYLAIRHVMKHVSPDEPILDAGADRVSTFLPTLGKLGYTNLTGMNLLEPTIDHVGPIAYTHGNIEETNCPHNTFSFIACLSTIEHGVNVPKFLGEAARILKPGGHLFISTDYWSLSIDTKIPGWRIFNPVAIANLIHHARDRGLELTSELNDFVVERVCHHGGCDYTFINLLFRKAA